MHVIHIVFICSENFMSSWTTNTAETTITTHAFTSYFLKALSDLPFQSVGLPTLWLTNFLNTVSTYLETYCVQMRIKHKYERLCNFVPINRVDDLCYSLVVIQT